MGIFDRFKKKKDDTSNDSIHDLSLTDLRVGFYVDYFLATWEVRAAHRYDWDGDESLEWQLTSPQGTLYLQLESDDVVDLSMSKAIDFTELDESVREALLKDGDPPKQINYGGTVYTMQESSGGHFFENGQQSSDVQGRELISWDYENADGQQYLTIEQWGETEFKASTGWPVQDFQFSNILPGANT